MPGLDHERERHVTTALSLLDPRVGRVIFVQPNRGVVLGDGFGVEPLVADLDDGSVADSAAFVLSNILAHGLILPDSGSPCTRTRSTPSGGGNRG